MGAVRDIMRWADEDVKRAGGRKGNTRGKRDWVDEVCTWERFQMGLQRTEAVKGVGCDGWNAYLLRRAPERVQREYYRTLKEVLRTRDFPEEWNNKVAMLMMKPGEDPCELERRRDIWLECHGYKLAMFMLGTEWEKAADATTPSSQAGSARPRGRGAPEQSLVMRFQKEQCAVERTMCVRVFIDMGVFFMSCVREVQWEA